MKNLKSLIAKIVLIVAIALAAVFLVVTVIVSNIIEDEVLEQWKTKDYRLVQTYVDLLLAQECNTVEEYQQFVDKINEDITLNYALFIENKDGKATAVAHSNPDRVGIILEDEGSIAASKDGKPYVGYFTDEVTGNLTLDVLEPVYSESGELMGALNLGIPVDPATMNSILQSSQTRVLMTAVACSIFLLIILSIFISLLVVKPIKVIADNISRMAKYDLTEDSTGIIKKYCKRSDEIGEISVDFEAMRTSIIKLVEEITTVINELSNQSESLSSVSEYVAQMGNQLSVTVNEVANGATNQAMETAEGQEQVAQLSRLIEIVEENMQVLNEATKDVNQIKDKGVEALEKVVVSTEKSSSNSARVHQVIMETSQQTEKIKEASVQIRDIAEQTNLLALNASIEAARAGEAGRGFAVVATEIGNLANGTNEMTVKIEEIIKDLVSKMEMAVSVIDEMQNGAKEQAECVSDTRDKFNLISDNIQNMELRCKELDDSTNKMEASKNVIVEIVSNLSAISQENAACMEEAAASVEEQAKSIDTVSDSSHHVSNLAEKLSEEIHYFKI